MVSYPSVTDIIEANKIALRLTLDRHPHKLIRLQQGIEVVIQQVKQEESRGLTYQAACLMRSICMGHFFDGANHRTAYLVTLQFLTQNGVRLKSEKPQAVESFMTNMGARDVQEVQNWIEQNLIR